MGTMTFHCPGADSTLDKSFDAVFMRSISFHRDDGQGVTRSTSFPGRRSGPSVLKTFGSGKMLIERSLSFKTRESNPLKTETEFLMRTSDSNDKIFTKTTDDQSLETGHIPEDIPRTPVLCNSKHEAAVKLQKVYKSFRTRRKLADCAVLVEQRWWKLLDFALLKTSTFFDIEKPETVFSRWSRARTKAAKVGKGLSKDKKAQKLAVQHWLEAIDPRHRYGHNLHFYYDRWVHYQSRQPFFYWLDVGEGKEVNLEQHCPRSKLQQQCIKYLGPKEREAYEVIVEDGKLLYKQSGQVLDTREGHKNLKWIFVLSTSKTLYVGQKMKGTFQHSSFLAGGATSAAGRLVVENGVLKAVWPHSGHYRPTDENFQEFVSFLKDNNVDLTDVKKSPADEDDESETRCDRALRSSISVLDLTRCTENTCAADIIQQEFSAEGEKCAAEPTGSHCFDVSNGSCQSGFFAGLQNADEKAKNVSAFDRLYTQCVQNLFREFEADSEEESDDTSSCETEASIDEAKPIEDLGSCSSSTEFHLEGQETEKEIEACDQDHIYQKHNVFEEGKDGEDDDDDQPQVPREAILHRINSKKGMKSYQLGKQLSFKWTTGAGPRIGCVRDYPSELQFHALEKVNLSPRHARTSAANAPPGCTGLSS